MTDIDDLQNSVKSAFDAALTELMDRGLLDGAILEARPVWAHPDGVILGQVRESKRAEGFKWVTAGNVPIDMIDSALAATPREALRHFSLKWQIDAENLNSPAVARKLGLEGSAALPAALIAHAEALYALTATDAFRNA